MANQAATSPDSNAPALTRIRALFAVLARLVFAPGAGSRIELIFAELETQLAAHLLDLALRYQNDPHLTADLYDARIIWRGGLPDVDIRWRAGAIQPLHAIMLKRRYASGLARIRCALARRHRFSRKRYKIYAGAHRRRDGESSARHNASAASFMHTEAHVAAPP